MFSNLLPLELFPQGGLTSSVITTVWVGVFVVVFFNLRLGWVLSGLVVPGYVVPLLIMKPWSAGVIFVEAIVTFIIVRFLSDHLSRFGFWSSLFGRDRFFAIVLVSVIVRLFFDGWLLPNVGAILEQHWQLQFDYRNNLYSFGLVIISLIANQFWKTGFVRAVIPTVVTIGVTYLIIRYGLMIFTNFTVSNLGYMYEDIASSVLASPKAYIILLTSAFIASRMNLRYGWDFNGILLPSLIALQWYQPLKVLTSFAEAFVILGIAMVVLRLPLFANSNIEGGRKLLLFFNIGFIYKLMLGYALLWWFPEVKITDFYAFGYLLATLMALKMHDKDIAARFTRATLQTSIVAVLIASSIGFSLTLLPSWDTTTTAEQAKRPQAVAEFPALTLLDRVREDKVEMYRPRGVAGVMLPSPGEMEIFQQAIELLRSQPATPDEQALAKATALLDQVNYRLERIAGRYLYLREKSLNRGWGIFVIDPSATNTFLLESPAPLEERGTADAAVVLFQTSAARALAIANVRRMANADGSADVLRSTQTFYHLFHHLMSRRDVLQVRGYTAERARVLLGERQDFSQILVAGGDSSLWVNNSLPPSLDLVRLKQLVDGFKVEWDNTPFTNLQRETTRTGFAELILSRDAMRRLMARSLATTTPLDYQVSNQRIDGYLQQWLLESKGQLAERGSDLYVPPQLWQLLFFDEEVLTPLLRVINTDYKLGQWSSSGEDELRAISSAARVLNYQMVQYHHRGSNRDYLILAEKASASPRRYWGTLVIRLGETSSYVVQVPRPRYEGSSFEYGVALFERLQAKALILAGAHPQANIDGSADVLQLVNVSSLFTLAGQVLLREGGDTPLMVVQSRAFARRPDLPTSTADMLVALRDGVKDEKHGSPLADGLFAVLKQDALDFKLVDGSFDTAGYEVGNIPQSLSLDTTRNKEFAVLWGSPQARSSYRQQGDRRQELAQFTALGISTEESELASFLAERSFINIATLPGELVYQINRYVADQNIVTLRDLQKRWSGFDYRRLVDRDSQQSFLVVMQGGRVGYVANLAPRLADQGVILETQKPDRESLQGFVNSRIGHLEFRSGL